MKKSIEGRINSALVDRLKAIAVDLADQGYDNPMDTAIENALATHFGICPECGFEIYKKGSPGTLDICDYCRKDFGLSGKDENGDNCSCVHCGKSMWSQCCPECRAVLPEAMWN